MESNVIYHHNRSIGKKYSIQQKCNKINSNNKSSSDNVNIN